jgi:Fic family protein
LVDGAYPEALADVIVEVVRAADALGNRLHPRTAASLAELVRVMNCYYSNLIEGHNTRPRDIERALRDDFDADDTRRDLQVEARAHIRVQRELDERFAAGTLGEPASREFVRGLHREFYRDASQRMLRIEHESGAYELMPGEFRGELKHDVSVGRHQPPSSARVEEFMAYFERRYAFTSLATAKRIVAMAAAHHRFNYIHPFVDGNGRVSRLMSHAMALEAGIGAHGLWSISRGLARGLVGREDYKSMMDAADAPRRGDRDGRGNLSLEALIDFVTWFCRVALDQLRFMGELFAFNTLQERLRAYAAAQGGEASAALVTEVLRVGELARGDAARVTGRSERSAREALSKLTNAELLVSDTPKGPVRLHFSAGSADALFPNL